MQHQVGVIEKWCKNKVAAVLTTLGNLLRSKWVSRIRCCVQQSYWTCVSNVPFLPWLWASFLQNPLALRLENIALLKISVFLSSILARCVLHKRANCFQQVRPCIPPEHESQDVRVQPWIVTVACQVSWPQFLGNKLLQLVPCLV